MLQVAAGLQCSSEGGHALAQFRSAAMRGYRFILVYSIVFDYAVVFVGCHFSSTTQSAKRPADRYASDEPYKLGVFQV